MGRAGLRGRYQGTDISSQRGTRPARAELTDGASTFMKHTLPGTNEAYFLRDGEGERYIVGGQLATVIARPEDTGGRLEAVVVSGRKGAAFPLHEHPKGHEAILL